MNEPSLLIEAAKGPPINPRPVALDLEDDDNRVALARFLLQIRVTVARILSRRGEVKP